MPLHGPIVEDTLLSVQVVIRNADSAASSGWATNKSERVLFRGQDQLTDEGIDNAFSQGRSFRKRYVDTGFIDIRYMPKQVYIRSSSVPKVLMSAHAFGSGLFKRTTNGRDIVPPIYTVAEEDDQLLVPDYVCPFGFASKEGRKNKEYWINDFVSKIDPSTVSPPCSKVPPQAFESIVAELHQKKIKMPRESKMCAKDFANRVMFNFTDQFGNTSRVARRTAGVLTKKLLANMNEAVTCYAQSGSPCSEEPRFRVFYTDDVMLTAIARIFRVINNYQGMYPEFSSALVFETRVNSKGPYVKIYAKNGIKANFTDAVNSYDGYYSLSEVFDLARPFSLTGRPHCKDCSPLVGAEPMCNPLLHECTRPTLEGDDYFNVLECPSNSGLFIGDMNSFGPTFYYFHYEIKRKIEEGRAGVAHCNLGQWRVNYKQILDDVPVYCKTCAAAHINENSFNAEKVLPVRSFDGLSYSCPDPYDLWIAYTPADEQGTDTWYYRRPTKLVCDPATGYNWNSPAAEDDGPQPEFMIKDWVESGATYDIGCRKQSTPDNNDMPTSPT